MADKITGHLEIGINDNFEVVMNLDHDWNGTGHIIFSPNQARNLARILRNKAKDAEEERKAAETLPGTFDGGIEIDGPIKRCRKCGLEVANLICENCALAASPKAAETQGQK